MRSLKESVLRTTKVGKYDEWNMLKKEHAHPTNKNELKGIIDKAIMLKGPNIDLNWIDVSAIGNMESLFYRSKFNGDISRWDVSKVKNMQGMFYGSKFNGDISEWNVSNVKHWYYILTVSPLEKNPPKWYK